ncbi:MAG: glycosyltransferase [Xanthobacteraceae bacterium]
MRILHIAESLVGGPASYLEEALPYQSQVFGAQNVILLAPKEHVSYLPDDICSIEVFPRSGRDARSFLALASAIRRVTSQHRPHIVHLHSSFAGAIGRLMLPIVWPSAKVVYCAHCWSFDRDPWTPFTRGWRMVERMLLPVTDLVVNVSLHERALLLGAGLPTRKLATVVSGLSDIEPTARPPNRDTNGAPLRLLFLGRMDEQKGIDLLFREIAHIPPTRAVLTVAGTPVIDGRSDSIPPHVKFLGWTPRTRIPALIAASDAVVMPSRWEGMPLAALEAMRSARPLIASNRGPFVHIVEHGINGFLVDIDRPGFLREALEEIEAADLARLGAAARSTFTAKFSALRMNEALVDCYLRLAEASAPVTSADRLGPVVPRGS